MAIINCPYDIRKLSITFACLDSPSRELFVNLYNAARAGHGTAPVPAGLSLGQVSEVCQLVTQEANELIALDSTSTTYTTSRGRQQPTQVNLIYRGDISGQEKYICQLSALCAQFNGLDEKSRLCAIHDYVCRMIKYDDAAARSGKTLHRQRFYDALYTGRGVCNAYAQGMTVLCHFSGLGCSYINGTTDRRQDSRHAWNIARIGGGYTYVDATWDAEEAGGCRRTYCGIGRERLYSHREDDAGVSVYAKLPKGRELEPLIDSPGRLSDALGAAFTRKPCEISLKFSPAMYAHFTSGGIFGTLARYGVLSRRYTDISDGCAVLLHECEYYCAYSFALAGGSIQLGLSGHTPPCDFLLVTDRRTMDACLADNWARFHTAMAREGFLSGNYALEYNGRFCYCVIKHAARQDVCVFSSEAELRALLVRARSRRATALTLTADRPLFDRVMRNDSAVFRRVMAEAGIRGYRMLSTESYVTLSELRY